jgi:hypothetical protein
MYTKSLCQNKINVNTCKIKSRKIPQTGIHAYNIDATPFTVLFRDSSEK